MSMEILRGIRVIDVTMFAFMPMAGGVLSHWGADVIKVEGPAMCDPMRLLFGGSTEPGGAYMSFKNYNRGKRAVTLDLASSDGQGILYRMVEDADVFLTSYLPATRRKLRIDVEDIRRHNPSIIYAKGTGLGPRGPEAERRAYDAAAWWARGSLASSAMQVSGADSPTSMVGHGDTISGTVLAGGICAALLQRERTGVAAIVDGSLLGTAVWFNHQPIVASGLGVEWGGPPLPKDRRIPTSNAYRTRDGRFISLVFVNDPDADWADLCQHLGHPELASDPRFATADARAEHRAEAVNALDHIFGERTLEEWKAALATAHGVWAPVQTPRELHDDPQALANGFLQEVEDPSGSLSLPAPPVLFDEEPGAIERAPDFNEHTDVVLKEIGLTDAEIARYREAGVVA